MAFRSAQLPTGSAMNTSGRDSCWSFSAASTSDLNLQQKHPPLTSAVGNPLLPNKAVSTSPPLWSLVIRPTRCRRAASRSAMRRMAVVLPAPRNPPIRTYLA